MAIQISCPHCDKPVGVTEHMFGVKIRCPSCKGIFEASRPPRQAHEAIVPARTPITPQPAAEPDQGIHDRLSRPLAALPVRDEQPRREEPRREEPREDRRRDWGREERSEGMPAAAIVGICAGAAVVLGLIVLVLVYFWWGWADEAPPIAAEKPAAIPMDVAEKRVEEMPGPPGAGPIDRPLPPFDDPIVPIRPDLDRLDPDPVKVKKPVAAGPSLPPVRPVELKPAPLKADSEERSLPSTIKTLCVGGGGRFVILHLPRERQLAIFDANEAKVVKYLPLGADDVKIAAGMDRLMVVMPATSVVQRWNLLTFEKEVTAPLPAMEGNVKQALMGYASNGPLCLISGDERFSGQLKFLDPFTLKVIDYDWGAGGDRHGLFDGEARVSGDGIVIAGRRQTLVLNGRLARVHPGETETFLCVPGADGRQVYSALSVRSPEGNLLFKPENPGGFITMPFVPAYQPGFFMRVEEYASRDLLKGGGGRRPEGTGNLQFYIAGQTKPFSVWEDFGGVFGQKLTYLDPSGMTSDRRYMLLPRNQLLITIPISDDKLILQRFDPVRELDKSGKDYLMVLSSAPAAKKGEAYSYALDVSSKQGGVKYNLDSGPPGMKIDAAGKLTWLPPRDFAEPDPSIIITISDAGGNEALHTFKLAVLD